MGVVTLADVVNAAADILADVDAGRLQPGEVEQRVMAQMAEQFGLVNGPGDPCWVLQVEVCRKVLEAGGLSALELAEWLAVQNRREVAAGTPTRID